MPEEIDPAKLDTVADLVAGRRILDFHNLPRDIPDWMAAVAWRIDAFSLWVGRSVCRLLIQSIPETLKSICAATRGRRPK